MRKLKTTKRWYGETIDDFTDRGKIHSTGEGQMKCLFCKKAVHIGINEKSRILFCWTCKAILEEEFYNKKDNA